LSVRGCASGKEGLSAAMEFKPDLILLDVMMPFMDGPTTLAQLREKPRTATIPVIFMTARAQSREIEHYQALGAAGVIAKPFDPMTLVTLVRSLVLPVVDRPAASKALFLARMNANAEDLVRCRYAVTSEQDPSSLLVRVREIAHRLAGSAGAFGFRRIGDAAAALEEVTLATLDGGIDLKKVERSLDRLLTAMTPDAPTIRDEAPTAIIDYALIETLQTNMGSDRMRVLLTKFEAQVDEGAIGAVDEARERAALSKQAHRMVSSAGVLGFPALSEVSRELEDACCEVEDRLAVLVDALERAGEIRASTKRELSSVLAQLERAN
jgi:two-component system OmpR family response regulator